MYGVKSWSTLIRCCDKALRRTTTVCKETPPARPTTINEKSNYHPERSDEIPGKAKVVAESSPAVDRRNDQIYFRRS